MPIILANDEIKKEIPGYEPDKSWLVHREADKILNNKFKEYINSGQIKHVIFMAGGAASGKTEFVESKKDWEGGDEVLVIDGTLSSAEGFKIKYKACKKKGVKVSVILIRPLLYSEAFRVFLGRKRKMKPESFLKTQAGVLEVFYNHITVEDYPDVEKQVYISYVGVEGGEYTQISLDAEDSTVEQKILMLKDVKEMYEQDSLTEQELFEIMSEIESS